jgi:shikimate kinase
MGSGKTSLGKKLSKLMIYQFIDLDDYIQKKTKKTISAIFEEEGEASFRKAENECLGEVLKKSQPTVISLGGGTVCSEENLEAIKARGLLVFIDLPASSLASRILGGKQVRPLLKDIQNEQLTEVIEEKLSQRKKYYNRAHITINGLNLTAQHLHSVILGSYKENTA